MLLFDKVVFKVTGMSCAACASSVERILSRIDGVEEVIVNLSDSTVQISYNEKMVTPAHMNKILSEVGFGIIESENFTAEDEEVSVANQLSDLKNKFIWSAALAIPVLLISLFSYLQIPFANETMFVLTIPILFFFGKDFFFNAWNRLLKGSSSIDTLVAIATGSALLLSTFNAFFPIVLAHQGQTHPVYFEFAAVIITLMLLRKYLEAIAKSHTTDSIKKLTGFQVHYAQIKQLGIEIELPIEQVIVGDMIIIRPGERIPVDGRIIEGNGLIDESIFTGEAIPVDKKVGDIVIGATMNNSGSFLMKAEKVGKSTILAQIIKLIKEAQGSKAPIQKKVDQVSTIFVPFVLIVSFLTALAWYLLGPEPKTTFAFITAFTVLIIACPCALGLAAPTAIMVGIGKSAEYGILIKEATSLVAIRKVTAIVLDKTGMITQGKPTVTDIILSNVKRNDDEDLLPIILGIESMSEHVIATAIADYLTALSINPVNITGFTNIAGKGVKGIYKHQKYIIGSPKWLIEEGVSIPDDLFLKINELSNQNKSLVLIGYDDKATLLIALKDSIKPSVNKAIAELKKMGIGIHLLTGDHEQTAAMVAHETGIEHFKGDVLPADKLAYIKLLQNKGYRVALIGDGTNDSQALTQANVGIAMGGETDIVMGRADIILFKGDLRKIISAIRISKRTVRTIHQNIFWAFFYNIIGIPLAVGILFPFTGFLINPMIAGAATAFSSVSVITNSLRLKRIKIKP